MVYRFGLIHIHVIMRLGMQGIKLLILINLQSLDYQPSIWSQDDPLVPEDWCRGV